MKIIKENINDYILNEAENEVNTSSMSKDQLKSYIDDTMKFINDSFLDESLNEAAEAEKPHRPGTSEYEANEGRQKRIAMYRKFANLTEDMPITEDSLDERALEKTCVYSNRDRNRVKAELLGQKWSDYEI